MRYMTQRRAMMNIDFVVGVVFFISVYATVYLTLPTLISTFRIVEDPFLGEASFFSDILVTTPGDPVSWTRIEQVDKLGLAYQETTFQPNILDINKVVAMSGETCEDLKGLVDITTNFKISIVTPKNEYSCEGNAPPHARMIERFAYVKSDSEYYDDFADWALDFGKWKVWEDTNAPRSTLPNAINESNWVLTMNNVLSPKPKGVTARWSQGLGTWSVDVLVNGLTQTESTGIQLANVSWGPVGYNVGFVLGEDDGGFVAGYRIYFYSNDHTVRIRVFNSSGTYLDPPVGTYSDGRWYTLEVTIDPQYVFFNYYDRDSLLYKGNRTLLPPDPAMGGEFFLGLTSNSTNIIKFDNVKIEGAVDEEYAPARLKLWVW